MTALPDGDDRTPDQKMTQEALEVAALAYLQAHQADPADGPLMLEGFVVMIQGRELSLEGVGRTTNIWATPDTQSVAMTLGLEAMLHKNVDGWFRAGDLRD